jgi:hypothetical protein
MSSSVIIHAGIVINLFKVIVLSEEDQDLETSFKVVSIMQTITEELDEEGKRAWRKMLGIDEENSD